MHAISYYALVDSNGSTQKKTDSLKCIALINCFIPLLMISLYLAATTVHVPVPKVWPWIYNRNDENNLESGQQDTAMEHCVELKKDGTRRYCR